MPLDFPPSSSSPYTGSNGVTYVWDGQKWVVSGSSIGPYLLLAGGSMSGPIALAADPTTDPQAANKHYVDASINLAGNYLGTWAVASNTPNISAGGSISNANYVATTENPATPEVVPVGVPGIAGMTVANGDRVIWASGLGVWQILRNAGVTLAAADARYYPLATNPSGYQTSAQVTAVLPVASSTTPVMNGAAAVGVGTTWARADHVHASDTSRAPLASPAFTGTPSLPTGTTAITQTAGNNTTALATTAFVQAAVIAADDNTNFADNSGFAINQRAYVSGTALASGAFGHDRWKGGASGCTYTFTVSTVSTVITISAGSLQQVVEGGVLTSGSYTLSWTGTAQGRTGAGSYAASPVAVTATAGTNLTIEFNTGTLSRVKLELGTAATPWQPRPAAQEIAACQRFYQLQYITLLSVGAAGFGGGIVVTPFQTAMRAAPSMSSSGVSGSATGGLSLGSNGGQSSVTSFASGNALGNYYQATLIATADL